MLKWKLKISYFKKNGNIDILIFQDAQYFSDSEHQLISGSLMSAQRQDVRRVRNRTLSGLENMSMVGGMPSATAGGMIVDPHHLQRPGSAGGLITGRRPITPSFHNDKDPGQQFVDFNPAGMIDAILSSLHK